MVITISTSKIQTPLVICIANIILMSMQYKIQIKGKYIASKILENYIGSNHL